MKFAIASILLAAVALAQESTPATSAPEATPTAAPEEMPGAATPATMPPMPMGPSQTESLLARLASYFDLSHVTSDVASMPVFMVKVFDPVTGKFNVLASSVSRSGSSFYVPVCPVDVIASSGLSPVALQGTACGYGVQLTPLPSNAVTAAYRTVRTLFRAILSTTTPSFMGMSQPQPAPQPAPQGGYQPAPQGAYQPALQPAPQGGYQAVPQAAPQAAPQGGDQAAPQGEDQAAPQAV